MSEVEVSLTRAAASGITRKRDRLLVDALIRATAANGGEFTEDVAKEAIKEVWLGHIPRKPSDCMAIVKKKIARNPNIRNALHDIIGEFSDGRLTMDRASHQLADHVFGEGNVEKPNFAALKTYMEMVLPMPAKKLAVGLTLSGAGGAIASAAPPVAARALGPATVEPPPDAVTVEFEDTSEGDDDSA